MMVTETVLDVELRKCNPVLIHPRRSDFEPSAGGASEPGLTLLAVPVPRRATDAWWSPRALVHCVEVDWEPPVAEELIWVRHCTEPASWGELAALAAGA